MLPPITRWISGLRTKKGARIAVELECRPIESHACSRAGTKDGIRTLPIHPRHGGEIGDLPFGRDEGIRHAVTEPIGFASEIRGEHRLDDRAAHEHRAGTQDSREM